MEALALNQKNDQVLLQELKNIREHEENLVVRVLSYLQEVEARKLHLARGYSSMFAFCTEYLRYSEAEAHIRIQAARLKRDVPELSQKIQSGQISLSAAAIAQSTFRKENLKRKGQGQGRLTRREKAHVIDQLHFCSKVEAERKLADIFQHPLPVKKAWIEIDQELNAKLADLKGLLAHKNFDVDLTKLVKLMADISIRELRKSKPDGKTKPDQSLCQAKSTFRTKGRSRFISIKVRREVWKRANGRCTYQDPITGKKCNGKHGLEIDHIHEFAKGGSSDIANLTLLCSAHNKAKSGPPPVPI